MSNRDTTGERTDRSSVAGQVAGAGRCRGRLRHPGRGDPARVRPALRLPEGAAHPRPARAGRRARGRGLRDGHRQGRGLHGHVGSGSDQPGHPDRRRAHGLGADGGDHRAGGRPAIGTDAFQEADIRGITMPITKHSFLVTKTEDIAGAIASAFHIAGTGRPGPVLVDITKDALQARAPFAWPTPARPARLPPGDQAARQAGAGGGEADPRVAPPVLYVGGGVLKARAWEELQGAGRADRHPGGDHADGPRACSRTAIRRTWGCRACTARSPRSARCSAAIC